MAKAVKAMAQKAHDPKQKHTLESSVKGISRHVGSLKSLLKNVDGELKPEQSKGMEVFLTGHTKHTTKKAPSDGDLLDITNLA
jgi:hypothetical protein